MRIEKSFNNSGKIRKFILLPKQKSIFYIGYAGFAAKDFEEMFEKKK